MDNRTTVIIGVIVIAAVAGGAYLYFTGGLPEVEQNGQEQVPQEVRSLSGRVTSINISQNSFVILQEAENRSFTVQPGEDTSFLRLSFPFDIADAPPGTSFTPSIEEVTVEDLTVGNQVFVRPASPVSTGDDIANPIEIQILP